MNFGSVKYIVVGAGFFGATLAERIASVLGEAVVVLEKRPHVGGNSFSSPDALTGIDVHRYGSHIFHTRTERVWQYINQFSSFNDYRHQVYTVHGDRVYPMPINLNTINRFFGTTLMPEDVPAFLAGQVDAIPVPRNFEEKALGCVGRRLYEAFIKGYTRKQWGCDPSQLPADILARLPLRMTADNLYFDDQYQGIPVDGYGKLFEKMLAHPKIEVRLGVDFRQVKSFIPEDAVIIYTGPIDRFFDYRFGLLGWRGLEFKEEILPQDDFQGNAVINYADETVAYTRIHEFKHYHPEKKGCFSGKTVIYKEYPVAAGQEDDPYYPMNRPADQAVLALYRQEALRHPRVIFGGRLGGYAYLDIDRTISQALAVFDARLSQGQLMVVDGGARHA
ncbi:MAG: UDP-galactopyranose mutase [Candidatus Omnitrophota bacterium]